jgi:hypothetical protein
MDEPRIRTATSADVPAIVDIVDQAYRHYTARIGKPPGPMLDDYAACVAKGVVWVLEEGTAITAIIVLLPAPDYLLLDNIAGPPGLGIRSPAARVRGGRGVKARVSRNSALHASKDAWRISASTRQSATKRRDAGPRPATSASSCASNFADSATELFPTQIRGTAIGFAYILGSAGGALAPAIVVGWRRRIRSQRHSLSSPSRSS